MYVCMLQACIHTYSVVGMPQDPRDYYCRCTTARGHGIRLKKYLPGTWYTLLVRTRTSTGTGVSYRSIRCVPDTRYDIAAFLLRIIPTGTRCIFSVHGLTATYTAARRYCCCVIWPSLRNLTHPSRELDGCFCCCCWCCCFVSSMIRSLTRQQVLVHVAGDGPHSHPRHAGGPKLCPGPVHAILVQAQGIRGRGGEGAGAGVGDGRGDGRAVQADLLDLSAVPGES